MRFKLVSPKDTLIGHVDVPDHFREWLDRSRAVTTAIMPRLGALTAHRGDELVDVQTVVLVKAEWSQFRDAVFLARGTIEEFETIPGCSFSPSMAYLKTQMP